MGSPRGVKTPEVTFASMACFRRSLSEQGTRLGGLTIGVALSHRVMYLPRVPRPVKTFLYADLIDCLVN